MWLLKKKIKLTEEEKDQRVSVAVQEIFQIKDLLRLFRDKDNLANCVGAIREDSSSGIEKGLKLIGLYTKENQKIIENLSVKMHDMYPTK